MISCSSLKGLATTQNNVNFSDLVMNKGPATRSMRQGLRDITAQVH